MATATATQPKTKPAKSASVGSTAGTASKMFNGKPVPHGHRVMRGKLVPIGKRRSVQELLTVKEDKLAKLDQDYIAKREKLVEGIETFKAHYSRQALAAEVLSGRSKDEALVDINTQIEQLQAQRRAVKSLREV